MAGAVCLLALGAALGGLAGFRLGTQQNVGTTELPNAGLETDSTVEATTLTSAAAVSATESVTTSTTVSEAGVAVRTVQDGDTLSVSYQGADESIRLIGFDAPETGEPFSDEATQALEGLVAGETVRLEFDVEERDQHGRLLAYVWVGNKMVNVEILRQGVATVYTVPPNVKYVDAFTAAQDEAQAAGLGIWGGPSDSPVEISNLHPNAEGDDNFNLNDEWVEFRVSPQGLCVATQWRMTPATGTISPTGSSRRSTLRAPYRLGQRHPDRSLWGMTGSAVWNNGGDTVKVLDARGHIVSNRGY